MVDAVRKLPRPLGKPLLDSELPRPLPAFALRSMQTPDLNRILKDWMTHYRKRMPRVADRLYYTGMQRRFARHAKRNKILVAVDPDPKAASEQRDILGWICFKPWDTKCLVVHYIYITKCYRDQGLGTALLAAAGWHPKMVILSGHECVLPRAIKRRYGYFHNPFLLEEVAEW